MTDLSLTCRNTANRNGGLWHNTLIGSAPSNQKRPVIGREPSGPFSSETGRRILAGASDPAPHRLCSRGSIREIVGHHQENHPALTWERGHNRVRRQLNSVLGDFGPHLAFSLTTSLRSVEWCLRRPDRGLRTPPLRSGDSTEQKVVALLDRSPKSDQHRGNQQTAREAISLRWVFDFRNSCHTGMIEIDDGQARCPEHREVILMPDRYGDPDDEVPADLDAPLTAEAMEIARAKREARRAERRIANEKLTGRQAREVVRHRRIVEQLSAARQRAARIRNCQLCDGEGLRLDGGLPCDHVGRSETNARGSARVREAMGWASR